MKHYIEEPAKKLECIDQFDVVVVGGGVAGVAAALAARRRGAKVALLEKEYGLGGLATLGNVLIYLPICDGLGNKVMGGIAEELLKLSVEDVKANDPDMALGQVPDCWTQNGDMEERKKRRYDARFNPASFQLAMEALLVTEGVTLFYDTRFCSCLTGNDGLKHIIVENKSGRLALKAGAFVDATGDADICAAAGESTDELDSNVLCGWHYWAIDGKVKNQVLSKSYSPNLTREGSEGPFYRGHHGRDVSEHVLGTRTMLREKMATMRAENPDQAIYPFQIASIAAFRATRRLKTRISLGEEHMHTWFEDTVGLTGDWRKKGPVYAIPLSTLQGERCPNLFTAGRCMSTATSAWDVTRVIPTCAVTGEAAGAAAAITALEHDGNGRAIDVPALQGYLREQGGLIDPALVEKKH